MQGWTITLEALICVDTNAIVLASVIFAQIILSLTVFAFKALGARAVVVGNIVDSAVSAIKTRTATAGHWSILTVVTIEAIVTLATVE